MKKDIFASAAALTAFMRGEEGQDADIGALLVAELIASMTARGR